MRPASRTLPAVAATALLAAGILTATLPAHAATATSAASATDATGECAPSASGATPSLAVQDACGNHAMGSEARAASGLAPAATPSPAPTAAAAPQVKSLAAAPDVTPSTGSNVLGFDISGFQPTTNWSGAVSAGYKFVFIKATESTDYTSSYFQTQWVNAGKSGLLRGAYHFAQPGQSSGAAQANYFYNNGAAMSTATPGTLPPVLDAETAKCGGLNKSQMVSWINSFMSTLKSLTGRTPIIYTYQSWWSSCTGNNAALSKAYPLWVADPTPPAADQPRLPASWGTWTFWQWGAPPFSGGGDADAYHGSSLATLTSSYGVYPRIAGTDRFATSTGAGQAFLTAAQSSTASPLPGSTVYIASGWAFPDALSGGAAAGLADAPIMLVNQGSIPKAVSSELAALGPQNIVILGGTTSVDSAVQKALVGFTKSKSSSAVTRIGGADRFATSADVATDKFSAGLANVYIASGTNWPDALSGAAASADAAKRGPVLLVRPDAIPAAVAAALTRLKPKKITIFGGPTAVSASVASQLVKYTASRSTSSVGRLWGADRYATSASIATHEFSAGVSVAYVVSGAEFPDALAAAPLSALAGGSPVLLTERTSIPASITSALKTLKPKSIIVIGGSAAVAASIQSQLKSYVVG